jgi:hypothetical protein
MLLSLLGACAGPEVKDGPSPLGMTLAEDGLLYAGIARVDITPTITETFADLDGDFYFDGCLTDPGATRSGCTEPFEDNNGNGYFDATWMGGWGGGGRAARGVADPQYATALVLSLDAAYLVLVSVDAVGLLEHRTRTIQEALAAEGVDPDRVVIAATHDHQSADTVGLWGNVDDLIPGFNPDYQEDLGAGVLDAVRVAAGGMVAVTPSQGVTRLVDDPELSGEPFGGSNPDPRMYAGIRDTRDPTVADDQVLAVALDAETGRLATIVSYSAHPEVVGYENDLLSSDYVGPLRAQIEATDGGTTLFLPAAVGGMQTAHDGSLPLVDDSGARVTGEDGATVFVSSDSFDLARAQGVLVAEAARAALTDQDPWDALVVDKIPVLFPVSNVGFEVALRTGLLDQPWETLDRSAGCPGYDVDPDVLGCVDTGLWRLQLGPVSFLTVPGELFPELFWGVPEDPSFDTSARSGSPWFPHHPEACDAVAWSACREAEQVDGCDCLEMHAAPYTLANEAVAPMADVLPGPYKAAIGLANGYVGYVIPEPDYHPLAGPLTGLEGNHSEEWYSAGDQLAPVMFAALAGAAR